MPYVDPFAPESWIDYNKLGGSRRLQGAASALRLQLADASL